MCAFLPYCLDTGNKSSHGACIHTLETATGCISGISWVGKSILTQPLISLTWSGLATPLPRSVHPISLPLTHLQTWTFGSSPSGASSPPSSHLSRHGSFLLSHPHIKVRDYERWKQNEMRPCQICFAEYVSQDTLSLQIQ